MGVSRIALSSLKTLNKSDSFLDGNPPYIPTSFESIATFNGTGSGGTVNFANIPSTYKHLQIRITARGDDSGATLASLSMYLGNGSPDTGTNYTRHDLNGNGSTASALGQSGNPQLTLRNTLPQNGTTANAFSGAIVDLLDYSSSTKYKTMRAFTGTDLNGAGSGSLSFLSGLWMSNSIVNYIRLTASSNFLTGTKIALYGIKG
jgi:hypothetical protein